MNLDFPNLYRLHTHMVHFPGTKLLHDHQFGFVLTGSPGESGSLGPAGPVGPAGPKGRAMSGTVCLREDHKHSSASL